MKSKDLDQSHITAIDVRQTAALINNGGDAYDY